jgi:hypothetical protein
MIDLISKASANQLFVVMTDSQFLTPVSTTLICELM